MRAITFFRGAAWLGAAVVFWSLNVRWDADPTTGGGPPAQWERHVVGAALLAVIAALALSVSGRGERPPSWVARGVAAAGAVGVIGIALYLRYTAKVQDIEYRLLGQGWTWLLAGGGLVLGAVVGSLGLRPAEKDEPRRKKRRRRSS
jgi:hypothetical protein